MTLCNRAEVEIYWSPDTKRITARTVPGAQKCGRAQPLPDGALLVGSYAHPFSSVDFLGDLEDLLAALAMRATARSRQNDAGAVQTASA
jgi:hypothetical protein